MDLEFKVKSIRIYRPKRKNTLALATVNFQDFCDFRFRIAQDDEHDRPTVYPLRHGEGGKKLVNTFNLNKKIMETVQEKVLEEYFRKINEVLAKPECRIFSFPLRLPFYFYSKEKENMTAFRIWFVCRYLADQKGNGFALLPEVASLVNLQPDYVARICQASNLFSGMHKQNIYFVSTKKVFLSRKRRFDRFGLYRQEKINKTFLANFRSNKRFAGYILKIFAEKDLDKSRKQTHGRISQERLAKVFHISPRTVWHNLKCAQAKRRKNIHEYPWVEIKGEFSAWLLHNLELRPDPNYPQPIEASPKNYLPVRKENKTILARRFPHIFNFTGFFQVLRESQRGKTKSSSLKCNNS